MKTNLYTFTQLPLLTVLACLLLTGCASNNDETPTYANGQKISDPFEGYNRAGFKFNDALDQAVLEPTARGYKYVMPDFAETGVRSAVRNLRSPLDFGNQVLQADFDGALGTLSRAMINTTFGVLGFVDLAADAGIPYEREDFGQTLAVWGVGHGPYIVAPLIGPASLRDHLANFGEALVDPVRLYLFNTDEETTYYIITTTALLDRRVQLLDILADLRKNSIDYYASVRSLYYQNRQAMVNDMDPERERLPEIPDYSDEDL